MAKEQLKADVKDFVIVDEWYHLIPPIARDDEATMVKDISKNGIRLPLIVTPQMEIIDGYQRHRLTRKYKELPREMPYEVKDIPREDVPKFIFAVNFQRRQLSRFNRAKIAVETAEKWGWFGEAKEKSLANLKKGDESPDRENSPTREQTTNEKICDFFGVTEYYVKAAIRLKKAASTKIAPNLLSNCVDGTIRVNDALVRLDKIERQLNKKAEKTIQDSFEWIFPLDTIASLSTHLSRLAGQVFLPSIGDRVRVNIKVLKPQVKKERELDERPWKPHPFQDWVCKHGVVGGCKQCYRDPDGFEHGKLTATKKQDTVEVPIDRAEMGGYRVLPDKDLAPCMKCDFLDVMNDTCTLEIGTDEVPKHCRKWRKDVT